MQSLSSSHSSCSARQPANSRRPFTASALPPVACLRVDTRGAISRRSASGAVAALALLQSSAPFFSASSASAVSVPRNVMAAGVPSAHMGNIPAGNPLNKDLLVVGPGVLGSVLAKDWLATVPGATATGLTNTDKSHERLRAMGIAPATRATLPEGRRFSFVAFSAPPSGSQDYEADVKAALALWNGSGSFVFTSSMSVCAVDDGSAVTQDSCPLVPRGAGPSTDKLLAAEDAVLQAGGNVLRLVGLYHANRGAHTFFMKVGTVARPGGYAVNLLHYEDAAGLAAAILRGDGSGPFRGRVFLGADGHPITFDDMMEVCFSSGVFPRVPVTFTGAFPEGGNTGRGKIVDPSASAAALGGWAPKYPSFAAFMNAGGKDFYNTSGIAF